MTPEAACWLKLRQRSTLVNNEQCLIDLHDRLLALEARGPGSPVAVATDEQEMVAVEEATGSAAAEPQRLPDIAPISVKERLPELHELDRQGRCWAYRSTTHEPLGKAWVLGTPVSLQLTRPWCSFTHWLPFWSLPIVEDEAQTD